MDNIVCHKGKKKYERLCRFDMTATGKGVSEDFMIAFFLDAIKFTSEFVFNVGF